MKGAIFLLRGILLLGLLALLFLPEAREASARSGVAWLRDGAELDSVLIGPAPRRVARSSLRAPGAGELDALAGVAARAPLWVALPRAERALAVAAPAAPVAERAAAIPFRLRGAPGDTVRLRLSDATGALDSARIVLDRAGAASGALRVRPARAGWHEWTMEAGGETARTGARIAPGAAPRVLVVAGPPGWESKFVVRALEESGARVRLVQPLGRGLEVGDEDLATDPGALDGFDAVLLLDGATVGPAQWNALESYAARLGGGVLRVGGGESPLGVVAGAGRTASTPAGALRWNLPPELSPLPAAELRASVRSLGRALPGSTVAATAPAGAVLALRPLGRGRAAALGLPETWRWRMEAGRTGEHREFWRSLVDWLSGGADPSPAIRPEEAFGAPGVPTFVRVTGGSADSTLTVQGPGGEPELLPLRPDPVNPETRLAHFVPPDSGLYTFAFPGAEPSAALRVRVSGGADSDAWARLALLADASGGGAVPADSLRARVGDGAEDRSSASGEWPRREWLRLELWFALLVAIAAAEWGIRRLNGWA